MANFVYHPSWGDVIVADADSLRQKLRDVLPSLEIDMKVAESGSIDRYVARVAVQNAVKVIFGRFLHYQEAVQLIDYFMKTDDSPVERAPLNGKDKK